MKALYIHIPFCVKKCSYCDFVSYPGCGEETVERYVKALCDEILFRRRALAEGVSTAYFGGGTPSLLAPRQMERIFSGIKEACPDFPGDIEITVEVNPATAGRDKLRAFKDLGFNRISLGIQTFDDRLLSLLGRIHSSRQALETYDACRAAGFDNVNIDLMFALPGQELKGWQVDLKKAVSLSPEHFSLYNLQVEEGTPLWERRMSEKGSSSEKLIFPSEEEDAGMYVFASAYMASRGYRRYEISNFALEGKECLHNTAYWENKNYIGLGVAAHSHVCGRRRANTSSIEDYLASPGNAVIEETGGTPLSVQQETVFLGLRMEKGVEKKFFQGYEAAVSTLAKEGLLEENGRRYRLTERGVLLANRVFEHFV